MNTQCSAALLESALAGTLPTEDENSLHRHLRECEECSAALEQMAGGPAWCREAASLLTGDELDPSVSTGDRWSEADFTVEYLEPTDEPNVLGRLGGLGGYDVLEIIGSGGMGIVLKGFERELKRCVAIKVLAPHLAQSSLAKKRFAREAQAAAAVVHPNVMAIHQVQPNGRLPFLVMPLVAGESLAERLAAKGSLELKEILRIGMQAAAGLAAAHEQGLVHRDVKPANLLLERGVERAVLTDFGLACAADDVSLTRYGIIAGTPQYMSPEQAKGEAVDGRSDLFSLGCVLYEMASGVSPFRADSTMATLRRLIDEPPRALASLNPELPPWFVAIVDRLLEKDPSQRFRSAKEVSELLENCLAHVQQPANVPLPAGVPDVNPVASTTRPAPRWSKRRRFGTMAAIFLFSLVGFAAVLLVTDEPSDISGEWTAEGEGDGWGKVVLRKTGPNEYAGTFTDTTGKEPGKIELKWSRIERRYNGTWSEGDDRFGKLSVRLVGGEIRGAWTTSRASRINPGTPELADLLWVRAKAAAQAKDLPSGIGKTPAEVNWEFGPVINQTLTCPESSRDSWRKGTALRLADNMIFNLPVKSATGKGDLSPEELVKWYDETKVNLVIDYWGETDQWELKLRNVKFADVANIPSDVRGDWKTLSANELQERFSKLEWRKTTNADTIPNGKGFQSLLLTRGQQPGMSFAFETSDGHRGVLQFTRGTKGRDPMKEKDPLRGRTASIRYKLLQPADTPAKKDTPSGTGKKPPDSSWAYGPIISRTLLCPGSDQNPRLGNGNVLRLEDGMTFYLPTKPASGKGDISREELVKWYDENKVNLVIDYRAETDQWELKLRNVRLAEVAKIPLDSLQSFMDWKSPSANELQERFSKFEWRKTANADADLKEKGFQSLLLDKGERPWAWLGVGASGMSFAFETSDDHRGILQILTSNTGAPRSKKDTPSRNVLIRYKLLQPADASAKKDTPSGIGKKPPEAMDGNKDLESLAGTWNIDTMGWGNNSVPKELMKGYKFVFAGNELTWEAALSMMGRGGKITANDGAFPCDFKIDPSKKPKEIDITLHQKQVDHTFLGIYEIEGDALKVCYYVRETGRRPTEFSSKDEPKIGFITLTRAKQEQPAPSKDEKKDAERSKTPTAGEPVKAPPKQEKDPPKPKEGPMGIKLGTAEADEADAVKLVEKLGGKIMRDDKQPAKPVVGVDLSLKKVTDADLKELKELKQLASLNLFGCRAVTDAGVKELKELKQLDSLILMRTQVTEAGVKELKDLKQLTKLILGGTQGTDAGLKELKDLKHLTELRIIGCPVTNAGLKELKDFKQLTKLDISGCKALTDDGLKELKALKQLTDLDLTNTKVTDAGLKEVKELTQLTRLMLGDTQVTDAGLKELTELKQLTTLNLRSAKVTDAGVKELQEALPKCKISGPTNRPPTR